METIIYQGRVIACEELTDRDFAKEHGHNQDSRDTFLRGEDGHYYLHRAVNYYGPLCLTHRLSLNAAILWACKYVAHPGVLGLYFDATDLLMGDVIVCLKRSDTGEELVKAQFKPDVMAGVRGFGAALGLDFGEALTEIIQRGLDREFFLRPALDEPDDATLSPEDEADVEAALARMHAVLDGNGNITGSRERAHDPEDAALLAAAEPEPLEDEDSDDEPQDGKEVR